MGTATNKPKLRHAAARAALLMTLTKCVSDYTFTVGPEVWELDPERLLIPVKFWRPGLAAFRSVYQVLLTGDGEVMVSRTETFAVKTFSLAGLES